MNRGSAFQHRQRGVALLTAMLVVALASILAVSMTHEQELSIRRAENLRNADQAWEYARGLERLARNVLHEDRVSGGAVDASNDPWASRLGPMPVPGGILTGRIRDLDGRLNINGLLAEGALGDLQLTRFRRLLALLELDPTLADAVADWIDPDGETRPGGAEDERYTRLDPAYPTANQPLTHLSELRLVLGIDAEAWRRLSPHVAALPAVDSPLNVNTASPVVLQSLAPGLGREQAETLANAGRDGFDTVQAFLDHPALRHHAVPEAGLAVSSEYFRAHGVVELDDDVFHYFSLIRRDRNGMTVLARSQGIE